MQVSGVSTTSYAGSVLGGVRNAAALAASAAQRITPVSVIERGDTAELSKAARDASADDIAKSAVELAQARTQMGAMAALVKAQERMTGSLLDVLG